MFDLSIHNTFTSIDIDKWHELEKNSDTSIFQSFKWNKALWDITQSEDNTLKIHIISDSVTQKYLAIAPLFISQSILYFIGDSYNDYQCFLVHHDYPDLVHSLFLTIQEKSSKKIKYFLLNQVNKSSKLYEYLTTKEHTNLLKYPLDKCYEINYLSAKYTTPNKNRYLNNLKTLGIVQFDHTFNPSKIQQSLPTLIHLHQERWQHNSLFQKTINQKLYEKIADSLGKEKQILLSTLSLNNEIIALEWSLVYKKKIIWYKSSFNLSYRKYSPGHLLLNSLAQYGKKHQFEVLDFSRGEESFKTIYANNTTYTQNFLWSPKKRLYIQKLFKLFAKQIKWKIKTILLKK